MCSSLDGNLNHKQYQMMCVNKSNGSTFRCAVRDPEESGSHLKARRGKGERVHGNLDSRYGFDHLSRLCIDSTGVVCGDFPSLQIDGNS